MIDRLLKIIKCHTIIMKYHNGLVSEWLRNTIYVIKYTIQTDG